ncbi:MAG: FemAB family PEP-CTERM system-associated protein [Magnetococcales bacterium]|nr:FemAB family PEP-CTERM system-associated protein [Magnetococcales bacterium]
MDDVLKIRRLEQGEEARWDAFVEGCPEATFFHRAGWQTVLRRAFGHVGHFLLAEDEKGLIRGVLPLARVRSLLFGDALLSTPFAVYGGAAADAPRVAAHLHREAARLAGQLGVDHLELRLQTAAAVPEGWPVKDLYCTFRRGIVADAEKNQLSIPRKQRAEVRRGVDQGLSFRVGREWRPCWDIYAESLRNLGTPVFTPRYFPILGEVFGPDCETLLVSNREGSAVAAVLSFYFRDTVLPYYGGGTPAARSCGAYAYMYWQLMNHAAANRGCGIFDFGRSKQGTGSFDFKRYFGFEPLPLHYAVHLVQGKEIPQVNPLNPRYALFIRAWQKLPLTVANGIGPWLAKDLG